MNPSVEIYDPRLGQEFEFCLPRKKRFSSLSWGFFAINGVAIDWDARVGLMAEAISKTSTLSFAAVDPWVPGRKKLVQAVRSSFARTREFDQSLIVYVEPSPEALEAVFDLRRAHGGGNSGYWCIGGCSDEFAPPERGRFFSQYRSWNLAHILGQADKIGCALELDENEQSTLLTEIFPDIDDWLRRLNLLTPDKASRA